MKRIVLATIFIFLCNLFAQIDPDPSRFYTDNYGDEVSIENNAKKYFSFQKIVGFHQFPAL